MTFVHMVFRRPGPKWGWDRPEPAGVVAAAREVRTRNSASLQPVRAVCRQRFRRGDRARDTPVLVPSIEPRRRNGTTRRARRDRTQRQARSGTRTHLEFAAHMTNVSPLAVGVRNALQRPDFSGCIAVDWCRDASRRPVWDRFGPPRSKRGGHAEAGMKLNPVDRGDRLN